MTGSKYAAENSATTRSHRSSASLIAVTKFRPAAQSHTSSSTRVPGIGQLPGHPLGPRPVRTGMTDEEINTIPAHILTIPHGA